MRSPYLTPEEAARYARVSVDTIYRWCYSGKLWAIRTHPKGALIRILPQDLDQLMLAESEEQGNENVDGGP